MTDYEPRQMISGLGCALVVPAALVGLMLLVDEHLPAIHLLWDALGWVALCALASVLLSMLHSRFRASAKASFLLAMFAGGLVFLGLTVAEASPSTPDWLKFAFTALVHVTAPALLMAGVVWIALRARRRRAH